MNSMSLIVDETFSNLSVFFGCFCHALAFSIIVILIVVDSCIQCMTHQSFETTSSKLDGICRCIMQLAFESGTTMFINTICPPKKHL